MLLLLFSIFLFILSIVFIYVGNNDYEKEIFLYIGVGLIIVAITFLIAEFVTLICKPIEYKNFKIEYEVVKETITNPEDLRDANYTQNLIELNKKIKMNKEYKDNIWFGIFFNKKIAELDLLKNK